MALLAMKYASALYILINVALIALFSTTYLYVTRLEATGCHCSVHPYRSFIRYYPVFAVGYLLLTLATPFIVSSSAAFGLLMQMASAAFTIGTVIFFAAALKYIEYLIKEKCKCSEDVRREVLYYWSIVHLLLIVVMVLVVLAGILTSGMLFTKLASGAGITSVLSETARTVRNPLRSAQSLPGKLTRLVKRR
jgi:hypothetical protein